VEEILAAKADALVGGDDAVLVIDDAAVPKKGTHSVGVAPQYAGVLGKTANCQVLVSLTLARREVPVACRYPQPPAPLDRLVESDHHRTVRNEHRQCSRARPRPARTIGRS
jgi:SRSO17 transposase